MNFKDWMMLRGLSRSTAEKYAAAVSGPLTEWGMHAGVIHGALVAMESPAAYEAASSMLAKLPIFRERNARGHNMYSSALAQYACFIQEGFHGDIESDIEAVFSDASTNTTEKLELVKARIGQGVFRQRLLLHWKGCAVTGYQELKMLVASHIKPWSVSSNAERLDPFNGLLLIPNVDRAFDKGFVTFDEEGVLTVSPLLTEPKVLGIVEGACIALQPQHQPYMAHHRAHVFLAK
ncbi:HNH endonuclease [Acidovorax sp. NCPPB 4044]|uniref:HNH endonuclease n=1 Tax=Acidovorax sp. NCPPB 4044 TaxID=2940490 RepID=UPI0023020BF5|nr:HNH endonuclease signature motif containing protein [Acidovorax sp. NCPPB 4044]MDA8522791.1 HNH endonuclease [Acidovorax sp. NCPPB 4044]